MRYHHHPPRVPNHRMPLTEHPRALSCIARRSLRPPHHPLKRGGVGRSTSRRPSRNDLHEHSVCLVRPGEPNDVPGMQLVERLRIYVLLIDRGTVRRAQVVEPEAPVLRVLHHRVAPDGSNRGRRGSSHNDRPRWGWRDAVMVVVVLGCEGVGVIMVTPTC